MALIHMIQENTNNSKGTPRKEEVSVLIGKAWPKEDGRFTMSPLSEPVEGKKGEFKVSDVYPLILTAYTRLTFGVNKNCNKEKNQNTHWAFLNIEKDRIDEYKELCSKIGQTID
jgi:hypothetical protein